MATVTGGRIGAETTPAEYVGRLRPAARQSSFWRQLRRDKAMLLLAAPGVLYLLVFVYVPQLGNVIAFQQYVPFLGFASPFVGFDNFRSLFADATFWSSVRNTFVISGLQLIMFFPVPIALALLLNSLISLPVKRVIQSIVYLPHFISWVIIVALFQQVLGGTGILDHFMRAIGQQPINLLASPPLFKWMMTLEVIWKETGWGTIIYLAALLGIDVTLYEAAAVDGAGPWRRLWHVTLPGLIGITILLLILRLGTILTVGFEQILLQQNAVGEEAGEVLDTFVYFHGIAAGQWAPAAAAGLIKGIVGLAIVLGANKVAHLFGQQGVLS
jgi:putative aldouronate transport system permease protein